MGVLARLSPRRRLLVAALAVLIGVGLAGVVVLRLVDSAERLSVPAQDRAGPVLLVSGYGGGTGALETLAQHIRATGRAATVVPVVDDGTGDLRVQAQALDRAVDEALADGGAPSVDIVGYSAGGIVARLWAQDHDGVHKARRIVTLGTPHHGARIAATGAAGLPAACPMACQQLAPGSRLLAELAIPVPVPPQWVSVWTEQDEIVAPPNSGRLEGAVDVRVQASCPDARVGHGDLPTDPRVVAVVLAGIAPGAKVVLPPTPRHRDEAHHPHCTDQRVATAELVKRAACVLGPADIRRYWAPVKARSAMYATAYANTNSSACTNRCC